MNGDEVADRPNAKSERHLIVFLPFVRLLKSYTVAGVEFLPLRDQEDTVPKALESAVAMPAATFDRKFLHEDVFHMAAAYAFHIAENQPFIDGNKRTGLNAALVFLDLNGFLVPDADMRLYDAMIALTSRALDKPGLARLFRELAVPNPSPEEE